MSLVTDARSLFISKFGAVCESIYFSPGRVNLLGEHTDYNFGLVLPCAIHLGNYFLVSKNNMNAVRLFSKLYDNFVSWDLSNLNSVSPQGDWTDYAVGVLKEILPRAQNGFGLDILIDGDLPQGAGLSSSASLTAGLAYILNDYWKTNLECWELIRVAQSAENNFVGVSCGILDPFAVIMGQRGHLIQLNCKDLTSTMVPFDGKYSIVVINSRISRSLAAGAYNMRYTESRQALQELSNTTGVQSFFDVDLEDIEIYLQQFPILYKRARHIVSENERVRIAEQSLRHGDISMFGKQMFASHQSLKMDYEVSGPELDLLIDLASDLPGVVGAKMTGAGFGGCVVAVVHRSFEQAFKRTMAELYTKQTGLDPYFYSCRPADGIRCLEKKDCTTA